MVKKKIGKVTKSLKILFPWLSAKFYFAFYAFTNSSNYYSHILAGIYLMFLQNVLDKTWASIIINSHILAGIYLIFLKNVPDQTWRSFTTEFGPRQKYRKRVIKLDKNLALSCNIVALILGWYCVKSLMVNKFIKGIRFQGIWSKLGKKNCFERQLFPKILNLKPVGNSWGYHVYH